MKSFLEKYKPQKSEEIPQEINLLKELIKNKKHSLIFGPTGTVKTSSIYLIAKELDYETIEVNEFLPIKTKDISKKLKEICEKESIKFTEEQLIKISSNSNGDIRAEIND